MEKRQRFLIATDFGPSTEALATTAAALARAAEAEIVVLHALGRSAAAEDFARTEAACRAYARRLSERGADASETLVIRLRPADELIVASAQELGISLIAMGWGRDSRLGGTARAVLRGASCPLLLVGPESQGEGILAATCIEDSGGLPRIDVRDLPPLERLMRVSERVSELAADEALLVAVESSRGALTTGAPAAANGRIS